MRKRKRNNMGCFFFILVFILLAISGYEIWNSDYVQRKVVYKWPHAQEIHIHSAKYRVDPYLVVAVMKNGTVHSTAVGFKPKEYIEKMLKV